MKKEIKVGDIIRHKKQIRIMGWRPQMLPVNCRFMVPKSKRISTEFGFQTYKVLAIFQKQHNRNMLVVTKFHEYDEYDKLDKVVGLPRDKIDVNRLIEIIPNKKGKRKY